MVNTLGDGHGSQIWRSEDGGISWSQVETQAPWGDLVGFRVLPHGGKLFLTGGVDETRYSTAVWVRGEDGKWSMQRGFLSLTGLGGRVLSTRWFPSTAGSWSSEEGAARVPRCRMCGRAKMMV